MGAVATPDFDSEDPDWFISWMRKEWQDRTSTGEELEFWKFMKLVTDIDDRLN